MKKLLLCLLTTILLISVTSCNKDDSSNDEDQTFEILYDEARKDALSQENVARQKANNSASSVGGGASSGGFVWKPISESNGKLVVILPSQYKSVQAVYIKTSHGTFSASRSAIANGNRPHYRFPHPGSVYGSNITVTGGGKSWSIGNGGQRHDL